MDVTIPVLLCLRFISNVVTDTTQESDYRKRVQQYEYFYEPLDSYPVRRSESVTPTLPQSVPQSGAVAAASETLQPFTVARSISDSSTCSNSSTSSGSGGYAVPVQSVSPESRWSYLKCDLSKRHFVIHNVGGYLPLKVFVLNLSLKSAKLLSRL